MRTYLLYAPIVALSFAAAALTSGACGGGNELPSGGAGGPPGVGGFDPGTTITGSGSGSGAAGGTGGSTTSSTDTLHPVCDDTEKRCDHVFTYAGTGNEASVEVRGDFAADGWTNGVPMTKSGNTWSATVKVPFNTQVLYKLVIDGSNWIADPANPNQVDDGFGGKNSLLAGATCDTWTCEPVVVGSYDWRDAVLYFVFVDRFSNGSTANDGPAISGVQTPAQYQGGDWAGVTAKITAGYFNDLGVNTLWLTVPMDNTDVSGVGSDGHQYSAYHGYWPMNLDKPEERFGTIADLKGLVDAAHAKSLKVILDYAMNHVHSSSPTYTQHPDWFWPLNDGTVSNCVCGAGCPWDGPYAKRCWFTDYLPDFNFTNAAARKFSVDNAIWWAQQTGIDGFRLDAVKHVEDSWLTDLRARVKTDIEPTSGQHFYMVGETYTGDQGLIKYYVNPSMLDGQFDFPLRAKLVRSVLMRAQDTNMQALDGFMAANDSVYGAGIMSTFIGNHDVPRSIHFAEDSPLWGNEWSDGKDKAWSGQPSLPGSSAPFERLANAFAILYTTKGIPLVYYGDEVGMPGGGDPDNRRMMQWSGYSAGQSLLLARLKKLGTIRAAHPALRKGTRQSLFSDSESMVYSMKSGSDAVYVAVNRSDSAHQVQGLPGGTLTDQLDGGTVSGPSVSVAARSTLVLTP